MKKWKITSVLTLVRTYEVSANSKKEALEKYWDELPSPVTEKVIDTGVEPELEIEEITNVPSHITQLNDRKPRNQRLFNRF